MQTACSLLYTIRRYFSLKLCQIRPIQNLQDKTYAIRYTTIWYIILDPCSGNRITLTEKSCVIGDLTTNPNNITSWLCKALNQIFFVDLSIFVT